MTALEATIIYPIAVNLFTGFLQQFVVDARARGDARVIQSQTDRENAQLLVGRVSSALMEKLRSSNLNQTDLELLHRLASDEISVREVALELIDGRLTPASVADRLTGLEPTLAGTPKLVEIAMFFVDSSKMAIATDNVTGHGVTHHRLENVQQSIDDLGAFQRTNFETLTTQTQWIIGQLQQLSPGSGRPDFAGSGLLETVLPSPVENPLNVAYKRRFDRAKACLEDGSTIDAEREFAGLVMDLEIDRSDDDILFRSHGNLGTCYFRQGKQDLALEQWKKGYELCPGVLKAKTNYALGLIYAKRYPEADALLEGAVAADPTSWDSIGVYAVFLAERDGPQRSVDFLRSHVIENRDFYVLLANQLSRLDKFQEAKEAISKAEEIGPEAPAVLAIKATTAASSIIERCSNAGCPHYTLSPNERAKLRGAAELLEKAIVGFTERGLTTELEIHFTNLSAFYAALGDFSASALSAEKAIALAPNDARPLRSLIYARMQLERFTEAAEGARKLRSMGERKDGTRWLIDALVWGRAYADALREFGEAVKVDPDLGDDSYLCCLRARALFGLPDTAQAFQYLDTLIAKFPTDALPLLQKAELETMHNQLEAAEQDYARAEVLTTGDERVQIRQQIGLFWYRKENWEEAITRFFPPNVDRLYSPFLNEGLVCLFKLGRYQECLSLARQAIERDGYHELTYSLAANCYVHFRSIHAAIPLMQELVSRSGNIRYWLNLAQLYFRTDNAAEAEKLLLSAHEAHPNDINVLLLLVPLFMQSGRNQEATDFAIKARELDPESLQANHAVVGAALSIRPDANIDPRYARAFQESLGVLTSHPESGVRAIPFEPNLASITEVIAAQTRGTDHALQQYNTNFPSLALLTRALGQSPFEIWSGLITAENQAFYIAEGTPEEQTADLMNLGQAEAVVLDITSLFTLQHVGLLEVVKVFFINIHVPHAVFESIKLQLDTLRIAPEGHGFLTFREGHIHLTELSAQAHANRISFVETILNFLRSLPTPEGIEAEWEQIEGVEDWSALLPPVHGDAALIAKGKSCCLLIDDLGIRSIATNQLSVKCAGTPFLLVLALSKGIISRDQYDDAVLILLRSGYTFVSDSKETTIRELKAHDFELTPLARQLLSRSSNEKYAGENSGRILSEILVHCWNSAIGIEKWQRLIQECAGNFSIDWAIRNSLNSFIVHLFLQLAYQPSAYFAIVSQMFGDSRITADKKSFALELSIDAIITADRVSRGRWVPQIRADWREKLNQLKEILRSVPIAPWQQ